MNTFLPYADFSESAKVLDVKRLGKQRVENLQLLQILTNPNPKAWRNHPAVLMWKGFESYLAQYSLVICIEWRNRGYNDTVLDKIRQFLDTPYFMNPIPPWIGDESFHSAYRSNLLRKDEKHYRQFGWTEPIDLPYLWPTKNPKYLELYKEIK